MDVITWLKDCDCEAPSRSGQIRTVETSENSEIRLTATFYPMMSCDKCGKPWVREILIQNLKP